MPRKRRYRMKGRGELQSIETANRNRKLIDQLKKPKPPLQQPGQLYSPISRQGFGKKRKGMRGGAPAYVDKYGAYVHNF